MSFTMPRNRRIRTYVAIERDFFDEGTNRLLDVGVTPLLQLFVKLFGFLVHAEVFSCLAPNSREPNNDSAFLLDVIASNLSHDS